MEINDEESQHLAAVMDSFKQYRNFHLRILEKKLVAEMPQFVRKRLQSHVDLINRNAHLCHTIASQPLGQPVDSKGFEQHMEKVRSTLRQFVRDWSIQGRQERQMCYDPILRDLETLTTDRAGVQVLVPGAGNYFYIGLGRLAWEIFNLGYSCQV